MRDPGEVWVRVPRELFDDTRQVLLDAATDLSSVAKASGNARSYLTETAIRLRLVRDELNAMGRGVLVSTDRGKGAGGDA